MVEILKLKLMKLMLNQDSEIVICSSFVSCALLSCDMNSTLGSVVPLAMFVNVGRNTISLCSFPARQGLFVEKSFSSVALTGKVGLP